MRRIPYRIVLPVIQLVLYLVLVWFGCYYRPTWQAQFQHWTAPRPADADAVGWDPVWIDGPPSFAEQLAFGINTPAALAAGLVLVPFGSLLHNGASQELAAHTTTALLIPVLWFFIGRRLERQSIVATRPSTIGKASAVATLVIAALIALLIAASLVVRFGELLAGRLLILAWAIGAILILSRKIRRWRLRVATS